MYLDTVKVEFPPMIHYTSHINPLNTCALYAKSCLTMCAKRMKSL